MNAMLDGSKQWKCPGGHVLGVVERVRVTDERSASPAARQARHVSRLLLFRQAIDADCEMDVDVIAAVEGTALNVRCSICGGVRPWYIGVDALERLIERVNSRGHRPPTADAASPRLEKYQTGGQDGEEMRDE